MSRDEQFDAVIRAFASYNRRRAQERTPEQIAADERATRRRDPKHMKALERRRKRKRGGPK